MKFFARPGKTNHLTPLHLTAGSLVAIAASTALISASPEVEAAPAAKTTADWSSSAYRGSVEVIPAKNSGNAADQQTLDGVVFEDRNKNSKQDAGEPGLPNVTVSNGRDVVSTDGQGRYELPAYNNMTAFVTQPRGFLHPPCVTQCRISFPALGIPSGVLRAPCGAPRTPSSGRR